MYVPATTDEFDSVHGQKEKVELLAFSNFKHFSFYFASSSTAACLHSLRIHKRRDSDARQ
jgi:hypothetical protein